MSAPTTTYAETTTQRRHAGHRVLDGLESILRYYLQRGLGDESLTEAEIRLATALVRYRYTPPTAKLIQERTHVMVFGGAGTGKSTVANILVGAEVAEVNAQAGYTRHPVAFFNSEETDPNVLLPRQLGMLSRVDDVDESASVDEDAYGWRLLPPDPLDPGFLRKHVVWDCPDLTARTCDRYQARVVEIAALADVCVYVASDERYNDEVPTNFLKEILEAGKPVVVALTKVDPYDAQELVQLFKTQVLDKLRNAHRIAGVVCIPSPLAGKARLLWTEEFPHTMQLREAVESASADFRQMRRQGREGTLSYLRNRQSRLLDPLRQDIGHWQEWLELVRQTANDAVFRYEREYLSDVDYLELKDSLDRLQAGFELKGPLSFLWRGLEFLRVPYRMARSSWKWMSPRPVIELVDEERVLDRVRQGILETLQVACASRRHRHGIWDKLHKALLNDVLFQIEPTYHQARIRQRRDLQARLRETSRKIHEKVHKNNVLVNAMRAGRIFVDVTALSVMCYFIGISLWLLPLLPFTAGVVEDMAAMICRRYVDLYRTAMVKQQRENILELIQKAYIDPLWQLPGNLGRELHQLAGTVEKMPMFLSELSVLSDEPGESPSVRSLAG